MPKANSSSGPPAAAIIPGAIAAGSPLRGLQVATLVADRRSSLIVGIDAAAATMLGGKPESLMAKPLAGIFDDAGAIPSLLGNDADIRAAARLTAIRRIDGTLFPALVSSQAVPVPDGSLQLIAIVDVGDCQRALARSAADYEMARVTLASIGDAVISTDLHGCILTMNGQAERITGWPAAEAKGLPLGEVFHVIDAEAHTFIECPARQALAENRPVRLEADGLLTGRNGREWIVECSAAPIRDADGAVLGSVVVCRDVSDNRSLQQRVAWQAAHDPLTHLPNRALLTDRLRHGIAQAERNGTLLAVCYLDLDGFKPINDQFGHDVGDRVLVQVSERLGGLLREVDTVARIGGDEFVLLLNDAREPLDFLPVLDRLLTEVARPYQIEEMQLSLSASIGVAICPLDDKDPDTILRHADQAMYQAKQSGRNRYHLFDAEHDRKLGRHREELQRIRQALGRGEFRLFYQPKVNIRSGRVIGCEALIRWQHPDQGILPPAEFLPLIAGTDLSTAVDAWVIDEALRQHTAWLRQGLSLPVSVNISPESLALPDFTERLTAHLAAHPDVRPSSLEIEVLESAALDDVVHVLDVIEACRRLGVTFSLDDFGTGYSCLAYLRRLPVDGMKIDRSFIREMLDDSNDLAIVEGVISLAQVFEHKVIAEGVETAEHSVMLMRLGCDLVQGYGIAAPMPAAAIPGWVAQFVPDPRWAMWAGANWELSNFPLVVAQYDHVRWVRNVVMSVDHPAGHLDETAVADKHACRFGHWYDNHGRQHYGRLPEYQAIDTIHARVHDIGRRIVGLHQRGRTPEARALVPELLGLKDSILEKLQALQLAVSRK